MRKLILPFRQPLVVPKTVLRTSRSDSQLGWHYPSETTTQRFLPLILAHIPPEEPETRFSERAFIVFKVLSSILDQCGTSPHFIVCATNVSSAPLDRRTTGACVLGAMLKRGAKAFSSIHPSNSSPRPAKASRISKRLLGRLRVERTKF